MGRLTRPAVWTTTTRTTTTTTILTSTTMGVDLRLTSFPCQPCPRPHRHLAIQQTAVMGIIINNNNNNNMMENKAALLTSGQESHTFSGYKLQHCAKCLFHNLGKVLTGILCNMCAEGVLMGALNSLDGLTSNYRSLKRPTEHLAY